MLFPEAFLKAFPDEFPEALSEALPEAHPETFTKGFPVPCFLFLHSPFSVIPFPNQDFNYSLYQCFIHNTLQEIYMAYENKIDMGELFNANSYITHVLN